MKNIYLQLDEDRVLVEQLRLLMGNVASALIPTLVLSILLIWALSNDSNATALKIWGVILMSYKLFATLHARHHLAKKIPFEQARNLVWTLILLNGMDGAIWSSLAWITLDTSTVVGSILVISTIAGMVGSSMSRLSPVLPVFIAFVAVMILLLSAKVWQLGDPAYEALGFVAIVYLTSVTLMARNSAKEIRSAINLRFENLDLLEQLKNKTEIAEAAQRDAEDANAAKSRFLAAASHDLRQPMHAQGLFLEVLSRTELTEKQQVLLGNVRASSEASSELLDSLLDFSRIEAGVIEPQIRSFMLQTVLSKIENEFAPQARAKKLDYRSRKTDVVVQSDPVLLERILRNLVANAIRYTNQGGLLVACRKREKQVVIEIWDTGIGIASEFQEDIFREFHQLGNPERDRRKGLGLGLAIVQGLARTLEHHLTLTSIPQRGSVFRIALPVSIGFFPDSHVMDTLSDSRLLGVKMLVVDDDVSVREGMLHLLRDWGCESESAESIEVALALARVTAPDIVICDYRLREQRTGVEAIVELRALLGNSLPALLITGDTAPERLREAQSSGVPLLHKPVSPDQLYHELVMLLEKVELHDLEHNSI